MFVVVTTFYTLDGMKSILLPKFVFFRSRLRLSLKNTNSLFYCFIFILRGCCTSYYNIPSSLPEGAYVNCDFARICYSRALLQSLRASSLPEGAYVKCNFARNCYSRALPQSLRASSLPEGAYLKCNFARIVIQQEAATGAASCSAWRGALCRLWFALALR